MFNFFKRKAVQEPTVGDLLVSAVNEYDLYRLNAIYKKQIHQTGKAAGRHKRRAAIYRWQLEHQKGAMKLLGDILALLHERDPEYGMRGMANNLTPADAVLAALGKAFDETRASVLWQPGDIVVGEDGAMYANNHRIFEASEEERALLLDTAAAAGRRLQLWAPDAHYGGTTGSWIDLPTGASRDPAVPAHYYRLKPLPVEVKTDPGHAERMPS